MGATQLRVLSSEGLRVDAAHDVALELARRTMQVLVPDRDVRGAAHSSRAGRGAPPLLAGGWLARAESHSTIQPTVVTCWRLDPMLRLVLASGLSWSPQASG